MSKYTAGHSNVAIRVNNLGMVLQDMGELKEARKYFERALKTDEQVYGPDHSAVPEISTISDRSCLTWAN